MITAVQMVSILKTRKLQVVPVIIDGNGNGIGWLTRTIDGSRAGVKHPPYSTPEEAVEAAEAHYLLTETTEKDRKSDKIIRALERGRYFIRPVQGTVIGENGKPTTTTLFTAFLPDGSITTVRERSTFIQAVLDMEGLLPQ